jgi:hypothetical protein
MRRTTHFIFPLLIAAAFGAALSCTAPSTDAPPLPPTAAPSVPVLKQRPRISVRELEKRIHDRVNKEQLAITP